MVFRKLLKRFRYNRKWAKRAEMSRIDYLLDIYHDRLEGRREGLDGLNFLELVERQLKNGEIDLALFNITQQWHEAFTIANLYWGQGDRENAEKYLRKTLERYQRWVDAGREHGKPIEDFQNVGAAEVKTAAVLLCCWLRRLMVPS